MNTQEDRSAAIAVAAFPAFILLGSVLAFVAPGPFLPLTSFITYFLMIIMFGMGLTLTIPDFKEVAKRPVPIAIGVVAQFVIMPLGAVAVAKLLGLSPALAVGLLMLGSVPGGTSSNVIAYLAKGDVALSVAMTSVSTLLAGADVAVDGAGMAWSLAQTVLIPVIGGIALRYALDAWMGKIAPVLPWISILGIGGVVFPTVAKNREALIEVGLLVFAAVLLHNALGYLLGYSTAKVTGQPESYRRTVAIEVGTQSAGLARGMAGKFFSPEAALPGAVAAVLHNIPARSSPGRFAGRREPLPASLRVALRSRPQGAESGGLSLVDGPERVLEVLIRQVRKAQDKPIPTARPQAGLVAALHAAGGKLVLELLPQCNGGKLGGDVCAACFRHGHSRAARFQGGDHRGGNGFATSREPVVRCTRVPAHVAAVEEVRDGALRHRGHRHSQELSGLPQRGSKRGGGHDIPRGELAGEERGERAEREHVGPRRQRRERGLRRDEVAQLGVEVVLDEHGAGPRRPVEQCGAARCAHRTAKGVQVGRSDQERVEAV